MEGLLKEYGKMVDAMDPFDFEDLIANLAMAMGFDNVRKTARTSDKGIDVLATLTKPWVDLEIGMQVKHQKGKVSRTVMDKLRGVMPFFDVYYGIVVTNSHFSKQSFDHQFVKGAKPVYLVDRDKLLRELLNNKVWIIKDNKTRKNIINRDAWNKKYGGEEVKEVISSLMIPQANKLSVMLKAFEGIQKGYLSPEEVGKYIGYTTRQGRYYRTALHALGFLEVYGKRIGISKLGNEYISSNNITRKALLRRAVLNHPLVKNVVVYIEDSTDPVSKNMVGRYILENTSLIFKTANRRASTIVGWLYQIEYLTKIKRGHYRPVGKAMGL